MGGGVKVKANGISIAVEDTGAGESQAGRPTTATSGCPSTWITWAYPT